MSVPLRPDPAIEVPDGSAKKGAKLFKSKCAQCHTLEKGGTNKGGPNLFGIFGKQSGSNIKGFKYSEGNKSSGIVWNEKHLSEFLTNPKQYMPGTNMVFAGLKKDKEKADLIAHIKTYQNQ